VIEHILQWRFLVAIEQYIDVARQMNVDLTRGYLFRPTTPNGGIQNVPFTLVFELVVLSH
jgi:hypothetical protein